MINYHASVSANLLLRPFQTFLDLFGRSPCWSPCYLKLTWGSNMASSHNLISYLFFSQKIVLKKYGDKSSKRKTVVNTVEGFMLRFKVKTNLRKRTPKISGIVLFSFFLISIEIAADCYQHERGNFLIFSLSNTLFKLIL